MLVAFAIVTAVIFLLLFAVWRNDTALNIGIKSICFVMLVWATYIAVALYGVHL